MAKIVYCRGCLRCFRATKAEAMRSIAVEHLRICPGPWAFIVARPVAESLTAFARYPNQRVAEATWRLGGAAAVRELVLGLIREGKLTAPPRDE